jgi:hypothetical protein
MIHLPGIVKACINVALVEYIYRASSWPYSQNLTSCQLYPILSTLQQSLRAKLLVSAQALKPSAYTLSLLACYS